LRLGLALAMISISIVRVGSAQRIKSGGERKIVSGTTVLYPKIASQMRLRGIVKIVATVAANGKVVRTELIGGSPVFVPNAMDAVKLMRWERSEKETKEVLEIEFSPAERQ
jgi:outer membrane biosynthesis protein TonB